MKNFLINISSY